MNENRRYQRHHHRDHGDERPMDEPKNADVEQANATWDALLDRLERKIEQAIIEAREDGQQ